MQILDWQSLDGAARHAALARPPAGTSAAVQAEARAIIDAVRRGGDDALRACVREFEGVESGALQVTPAEFAAAHAAVPPAALAAMRIA
ncbi:MAG: histidinol dehydrogenase, partial [Gammaproteobacteria bacterium]|nr:histidinol dehydrogenase [Gammaproteobacteria bacterium]